MIQLISEEHDDGAFLSLAQRLVNGAITALQMHDVYLVQIDNWFDHKWLGWRSQWRQKNLEELRVPMFTPNRVCSEKHLVWVADTAVWKSVGLPVPLHVRQAGHPLLAKRLDRFSESAAFVWYSGNTAANKIGSLMFYLSGPDNYAWYASFKKNETWTVVDEFRITRRELMSFEERGLQMELAQA
jgi:hypothetical protein